MHRNGERLGIRNVEAEMFLWLLNRQEGNVNYFNVKQIILYDYML